MVSVLIVWLNLVSVLEVLFVVSMCLLMIRLG